jgi:hypothetical protein
MNALEAKTNQLRQSWNLYESVALDLPHFAITSGHKIHTNCSSYTLKSLSAKPGAIHFEEIRLTQNDATGNKQNTT